MELNVSKDPFVSSFLHSGVRFYGTQKSANFIYSVVVEIQSIDWIQHKISGLLRIEGLSNKLPTLTTVFIGEIIGPKHSFYTNKPRWESSDINDVRHWSKLKGFSMFLTQNTHFNPFENEFIFMRWKEQIILKEDIDSFHQINSGKSDPNSSKNIESSPNLEKPANEPENENLVEGLQGVSKENISYAGFYYIGLNQRTGTIEGLYYYKHSEMFQKLQLSCNNSSSFPTFKFL